MYYMLTVLETSDQLMAYRRLPASCRMRPQLGLSLALPESPPPQGMPSGASEDALRRGGEESSRMMISVAPLTRGILFLEGLVLHVCSETKMKMNSHNYD